MRRPQVPVRMAARGPVAPMRPEQAVPERAAGQVPRVALELEETDATETSVTPAARREIR